MNVNVHISSTATTSPKEGVPFYDAGAAVARAVGTLTVCVFALNKKSHREYRHGRVFLGKNNKSRAAPRTVPRSCDMPAAIAQW